MSAIDWVLSITLRHKADPNILNLITNICVFIFTGTLMAGNLCNSTTGRNDDEESKQLVRQMFKVNIF